MIFSDDKKYCNTRINVRHNSLTDILAFFHFVSFVVNPLTKFNVY